MDLASLTLGQKIAGAAGAALFIILFFPWYGFEGFNASAWEAFGVLDLLLLVVALAAVALAVAGPRIRELGSPVAPSAILAGLAALATLLVLSQLIDPPGGGFVGSVEIEIGRKIGVFLGLIAIAAVTYGAYLMMREEGVTVAGARDQATSAARRPARSETTTASPAAEPVADPFGGERSATSTRPAEPGAAERPLDEPPPTERRPFQ